MNSWELAARLERVSRLMKFTSEKRQSDSYLDGSFAFITLDDDEVPFGAVEAFNASGTITDIVAKDAKEIIKNGISQTEKDLENTVPKGIDNLLELDYLKTYSIRKLHDDIGIETVDELERALQNGRLLSKDGFGLRFCEQTLGMVKQYKTGKRVILRQKAYHLSKLIIKAIMKIPDVSQAIIAGDVRRGKETTDKLDILVVCQKPVREFALMVGKSLQLKELLPTKFGCTGTLHDITVRIHLCRPEYVGSALSFATGPGDFYQRLCTLAPGTKKSNAGFMLIKGDEELFYKNLNLHFIPPEIREWPDIIEISLTKPFWNLVEYDDILGDFHSHTHWSDGNYSIQKLMEVAGQVGLEYIAITDHAYEIPVGVGMTSQKLDKQLDLIRKLNSSKNAVKLIPGIEFNISLNGDVDFETRQSIWKIGSMHSGLGESKEVNEERYLKPIIKKKINALGHPTARELLVRQHLELDWDKIFLACANNEVAVELNWAPDRLDPPWQVARIAHKHGCRFVLGSDTHHISQLLDRELSLSHARRAGLYKENLLNCDEYEKARRAIWRES
jgi:DNA polymerase (family 10)